MLLETAPVSEASTNLTSNPRVFLSHRIQSGGDAREALHQGDQEHGRTHPSQARRRALVRRHSGGSWHLAAGDILAALVFAADNLQHETVLAA
jgi:hypothetical protein